MPESAAARALRLLDLVPYLHSHPGSTVSEVAKAFGVTRNEILKDLNLLFICGLPGYTALELIDISFDDEIIHVRDPQNLDIPRRLTERESLALRIALQALGDSLPQSDSRRDVIAGLQEKLRKAFSSAIPEGSISFEGARLRLISESLRAAIVGEHKVRITYDNRTKDEARSRIVHPLAIDLRLDRPYLRAWCESSNGMRKFALAQILEFETLSERFEPNSEVSTTEVAVVKLRIQPGSRFLLENEKSLRAYGENIFEMDIYNQEWIVRSAISYISEIEVVEPQGLRTVIADRLAGTEKGLN